MAVLQGLVGPTKSADGANQTGRLGQQGEQIASELHGRFYEQTVRGNMFISDSDSVTLAGANTTKGAAATIKLINGLFNPAGSGVNLVIDRAILSVTSGTPTGGFAYNVQQSTAGVLSLPTGTVRNALMGGRASPNTVPQTGVIFARADAATTAFTQIGMLGGPAAVAAGAGINSLVDEVNGSIIIPPGWVFGLTQIGASTAVVQSTVYFEEVPVLGN